tara:strand:+ start:73 stop:615 length:543 start_codon:yes stop_codon:yes gene_type:complete
MKILSLWIITASMLTFGTVTHAGQSDETAFELAMFSYEQGDLEQAVELFHQAIDLDPLLVDAYTYLGRSLLELGRWVEALERMGTAYDLMPEVDKQVFWSELWNAVIESFVGLLDQGDVDRALSVLDKALAMPDQHAEDRRRLTSALLTHVGILANEGRLREAISKLAGQADYTDEDLAI